MAFGDSATKGFTNASQVFANVLKLVGPNAKIVGPGFVFNNKGLFFYDTVNPSAGHLVISIAPADGANDGAGNAFFAGVNVYDQIAHKIMQMQAGLLRWGPVANYPTLLGSQSATAGLDQWQSSESNLADVPSRFVLRSQNNTGDGIARAEFPSPLMVDLGSFPPDPANNANLETFHNFAFAGAGGTLWSYGGSGIHPGYRLLSDGSLMMVTGRFTVPTGGPVAGQAMTQATAAAYKPNTVQSVIGTVITGANPNSMVRCFYATTGVLTLGGPVAALAAGDVIEIPASANIELAAT